MRKGETRHRHTTAPRGAPYQNNVFLKSKDPDVRVTKLNSLESHSVSKLLHPEKEGRILVAVGFYQGYGNAKESQNSAYNLCMCTQE